LGVLILCDECGSLTLIAFLDDLRTIMTMQKQFDAFGEPQKAKKYW